MKDFKSLYQTNTTVVETKNTQFFLGFFFMLSTGEIMVSESKFNIFQI